MKKLFFALFAAGTAATFAQGKAAVCYFSATGTTRSIAENVAKAIGADLIEIAPETPYSAADLNWRDENSRSSKERADATILPKIKNARTDFSRYDVIFVGYPIWWGDAPAIMRAFFGAADFSGKTIAPFCTSGSSPFGKSADSLKALSPKAKWLDGKRFAANDNKKAAEWAKTLGK